MGFTICTCNKDNQNIPLPYTNLSLLDNNNRKKNISFKLDNDSNQQSNNILETRKNININIININKEQVNAKKYSSNYNNSSCLNNHDTTKVIEPFNKPKSEIVKEESDVKECGEEEEEEEMKEEEDENIPLPDPKLEELKENAIKNFDSKITEFAEYISDEKFEKVEKSVITKLEENFEKFPSKIGSNKNKYIECFTRPALLFKKDNTIYKGSWNFQGKKEGFGIFYDSNGNKYMGEWKEDKFDGKGRILSVKGDCYEGDFKEGLIEGNGMFISTGGGYNYLGEFKNNKFDGKGKLIFDDNTTYEGLFSKGYISGEGNLLFRDGSYYKGNFTENTFDGKGKFYFHDGRKYNGDWKNNKMEGIGKFSWDGDTKYNGEYKNNVREGNGVYSFGANLYDGHWVNGIPHGDGTLLNDGLRIVGIFRYGKMVEMTESKGANRDISQKFTVGASTREKFDTFSEKNDTRTIIRKLDSGGTSLKASRKDHQKYNKESRSIKFKEPNLNKSKDNKKNKNKEKSKERSKEKSKAKSQPDK